MLQEWKHCVLPNISSFRIMVWQSMIWVVFFFFTPTEASSYIAVPGTRVLKDGFFCKDPATWSVDEVIQFMKHTDPHISGPLSDLFRQHVMYLLVQFSCCPNAFEWPLYRPFSLILSCMEGGKPYQLIFFICEKGYFAQHSGLKW